MNLEAAPGFEPGNKGFADPRLTTWLCRLEEVVGRGVIAQARSRFQPRRVLRTLALLAGCSHSEEPTSTPPMAPDHSLVREPGWRWPDPDRLGSEGNLHPNPSCDRRAVADERSERPGSRHGHGRV